MKWDDYKKLTGEEREEYKHKYEHNPLYTVGGTLLTFIIAVMAALMNLILVLVINTHPTLAHLQYATNSLINMSYKYYVFGIAIITIHYCIILCTGIYHHYKEYRWKKRIGLKEREYRNPFVDIDKYMENG